MNYKIINKIKFKEKYYPPLQYQKQIIVKQLQMTSSY